MQVTAMVLSLICLLTFALAAPPTQNAAGSAAGPGVVSANGSLPYPVVPFEFAGKIGGYDVRLNGTIQEIMAQMKKLHPDFEPQLAARDDDQSLEKLETRARDGVLCWPVRGQPWNRADAYWIRDGIRYLNGLRDQFCIGKPFTCARISCEYNSAIYYCNDNYYNVFAPCKYLGTYAQDILDRCSTFAPGDSRVLSCGQEFDTYKYNIIVREDRC